MTPHSEFILGGQRSGKSRRAESLALQWLAASGNHSAVFIGTATAWDDEMAQRIARHQLDRVQRVPTMLTIEVPLLLTEAVEIHSQPHTLVVIDCLTLWLTNLMMPHENSPNSQINQSNTSAGQQIRAQAASLLIAIKQAQGPVVLVGNEIGLGVIPMGQDTRTFVDTLGRLNQDVAAACERVVFMVAGLPLLLKGYM
jgi:adenosylcobinamide kinase / adenosylcobinamide-phosphate guanylyltransferase